MASRTLKAFIKEIPGINDELMKEVVAQWNVETQFVLSDSNKRVPIAAGFLQRSGITEAASFKPTGIQSKIVYNVPYASKLNDVSSGLDLKESGELSYYAGGQRVNKQRKGELGFLDLAVEQASNKKRFIKVVDKAISKVWKNT